MNNSFGDLFSITSFGESHGRCVGIVIDGCPAGIPLVEEDIQRELNKRKPSAMAGQTTRLEDDKVEILSGVFQGYTSGAPICLLIWNKNTISSDYEKLKNLPRPGHADYQAFIKYGGFNDYRGGGRFSGRITAGIVMAGAVAKKILGLLGTEILAHTIQIGDIKAPEARPENIRTNVYNNAVRCADIKISGDMLNLIRQIGSEGDSLGGIIEGIGLNIPAGLGEPIFDTLEGQIAKGLLAIPAIKGVEFGAGFSVAEARGSQNNDIYVMREHKLVSETNNAGGVQGGISNGMTLIVKAAVKPTPSISKTQKTVDINIMENAEITITGRHDVCLVPRAVIVVESMIAITLCDFALKAQLIQRVIK